MNIEAIDKYLAEVKAELIRAMRKHHRMHGPHEAYAVILEEMDELWDSVKADDMEGQRREAIQVSAMGLRLVYDMENIPTRDIGGGE